MAENPRTLSFNVQFNLIHFWVAVSELQRVLPRAESRCMKSPSFPQNQHFSIRIQIPI